MPELTTRFASLRPEYAMRRDLLIFLLMVAFFQAAIRTIIFKGNAIFPVLDDAIAMLRHVEFTGMLVFTLFSVFV